MFLSRRQFILWASCIPVSGCLNSITPENISASATAVGGSAGLVLSECIKSDTVRDAVSSLVAFVVRIVPDVGQDRTELWTTMSRDHIKGLVERGKMKSTVGCVVLAAFHVVLQAFNIIESRYPEIRTVRSYMDAAVDGFGKGFMSTFAQTYYGDTNTIDMQAYRDLKALPDTGVVNMLSSTVNP